MSNSVNWYELHAQDVSEQYESIKAQEVHTWLTIF